MKRSKTIKNIMFISTLLFISACTKNNMPETLKQGGPEMKAHSARTEEVILKKGKLIEVAYLSVEKGKNDSLKRDYFPKVMPLVKEYKGKMLAHFRVLKKTGGEISPQMIAIFEWPSLATKEAFSKDARYQKIKPIRDAALSFLKLGYYEMAKDTTILFKEDKVYEFFAAWMASGPDAKDKMNAYFKVSGPIKKRYGRPAPIFKTMFGIMPGKTPKGDTSYTPQMAGIVEWDQSNDYFELLNNAEFKEEAKPLMDAAFPRLDLLHTQIVLKP